MGEIRQRLFLFRPQIVPVCVYMFYLALLPALVKRITPCMNFKFDVSYTSVQCNTTLILDRFLILALAGFSVIVITMLFIRTQKTLMPLLITAIIAAGITVIAYYLFIPTAYTAAANAPILLESLLEK